MKKTHKSYDTLENTKMVKFVLNELKNGKIQTLAPCGNIIWKLAEKRKLLKNRTYQSMRDHFRRIVLPNLAKIPLFLKPSEIEYLVEKFRLKDSPKMKNKSLKVVEPSEDEESTGEKQKNPIKISICKKSLYFKCKRCDCLVHKDDRMNHVEDCTNENEGVIDEMLAYDACFLYAEQDYITDSDSSLNSSEDSDSISVLIEGYSPLVQGYPTSQLGSSIDLPKCEPGQEEQQ